ncbi:hypothetical protein FHH25_16695 [Escherichia coli]|nr:hypothetical protein [Escherichia coli]EFB2781795.1 hypothetical protein [Escherichia coli]EFB9738310.1 hypothetical protein [Escherichia coli]EFC2842545.1 hypothetical protein [Escherichia coli]MXE64384.1 hypothetical protein [Escherichia coli]
MQKQLSVALLRSKVYPFCMLVLRQMRKSLHFLSAKSHLLNAQTGSISQRILQFFEISDLRIVTKICVGAQIMSDYERLM